MESERVCFLILRELRDQLFSVINSFFVLVSIKHFGLGCTYCFSKCFNTHPGKTRLDIAQDESATTKLMATQEE